MLLKPMRYKDYTWPHNPETYAVEYRRQVAAHKVPLGGFCLQDLGRTYRILRGEGTFAGKGAYEEFRTLAEVFDQTGPGLLVHPVWRTGQRLLRDAGAAGGADAGLRAVQLLLLGGRHRLRRR